MQESFIITELIFIFEISRPTHTTVKSREWDMANQLRNTTQKY
jgi:hypothetical protein